MSAPVRVAVVGASGRTGGVIVDGLLESETNFEVTALARASSVNSEAYQSLGKKGVNVVVADLVGPKEDLVKILTGIDVIVSAIFVTSLEDQVPLAEAAKEAGVKRFVPCFWATSGPRGVMKIYDQKLDSLDALQRLHVPYTSIDVGWWSQQMIPNIPLGRIKHASFGGFKYIPGDGTVPIALMSLLDIGTWVAKIITDPRTLNKKVFAYTEILTANQIIDLISKLGGEKVEVPYLSAEKIEATIKAATEALQANPADTKAFFTLVIHQYLHSWGVRGDNTPEVAAYLGYLDATTLYPEVKSKGKTMESILTDVFDGKPSGFIDMVGINVEDFL